MSKRIISFLLAVCLVFGLLPPGVPALESGPAQTSTLDDPAYTRDIRIWWGSSGEYEWHSYYIPEAGERFVESTDDLPLPDGVSFENDTLTLDGASLFAIRIDSWGDAPFRLEVLGENTIQSTDEDRFALNFYGCHDLLVDGGGKLNLSGSRIPLYNHDAYIDDNTNYPDGLLTFRDVTLNVECIYEDAYITDDNAWDLTAIALSGNTVFDGVNLYARGHMGLNVNGDLTITGGSVIDSNGFYHLSRAKDDAVGFDGGYYPAAGLIDDATLRITPPRHKMKDDYFIFDIGPGTEMTIKEGADITVDASGSTENWNAFIVHDDYTNAAKPGVLHLEGGRIEVRTPQNENCSGVNVATGSTWNQTGGEVILYSDVNAGGFSLWQDCTVNFSGGSITVHDASVTMGSNTFWNQSGGSLTVLGGTSDGYAFEAWEHGEINMTGGTMDLNGCLSLGQDRIFNLHDGAVDITLALKERNGVDLQPYALWNQTGGSFHITNDDPSLQETREFTPAFYMNPDAEMIVSGGCLTIAGDFTHGICSNSDLLFTGSSTKVDISTTIYEAISLQNGSTMTLGGGDVTLSAPNNCGILISNGSGLSVLSGSLHITDGAWGIAANNGHARFLGGETVLNAPVALEEWSGSEHHFSFGEGINALNADGTALEFTYEGNARAETASLPVTIKRQGAAAGEASILLAVTQTGAITAGVPFGLRMIPILTETRGTVAVTLPAGVTLVEDSVYIGAQPVPYTLTDSGFTVEADSGALVTFTVLPAASGDSAITASWGDCTAAVGFTCDAFRLSLPGQVNVPEIRISGTAIAGGSLVFYLDDEELITVPVSGLGTWSAVLPLPDEEGYYSICALLRDAQGRNLSISSFAQVLYDRSAPVVETLTVSNWIHGNTMVDPHQQTEIVINYLTGKTDPGYYIYWPDLPEFTLEAAFADGSGTPETVSDVRVIATDRRGQEETVALLYNEETGTWIATHDFCGGGSITPASFRVSWKNLEEWAEPEEPVWEPDHLEETETDNASGAFVSVPADQKNFRVTLSDDAAVERLLDGAGNETAYTLEDSVLTLPLEPGEIYVLRLSAGSFPDYPGYTELNILAEDNNTLRGEYEYWDNVYPITSGDVTDLTDRTFVSENAYSVGDVLIIDSMQAIAVTAISGDTYAYENAALDQVYKTLDVSGIDVPAGQELEIIWEDGASEEALEAAFMESQYFAAWEKALEDTVSDPNFEFRPGVKIGDATVDIGVEAKHEEDGTVVFKLSFKIEAKMKTKLPVVGEEETSVAMEMSYETREKTTGRLRMNEGSHRSYYLISDETTSKNVAITVSVGDDPNANPLNAYFSDELEKALKHNYLAELESGGSNTLRLPLLNKVKIPIPTPLSPAVTFYFRPSVDIELGFFGEVEMEASYVTRNTQGMYLICRGPSTGWEVSTFSRQSDPEVEASARLHLSTSLAGYLRAAVGISAFTCLDMEVYARIGAKLALSGHGNASYNFTTGERSASAELLFGESIEFDIGVSAFLNLKFLSPDPLMDYTIYSKSFPLIEIGQRVMPTEFEVVEEDPVYVRGECDLKDYIDLKLRTQSFQCNGKIYNGAEKMPDDKYSFELISGPGTLTRDGQFTVSDRLIPCDFEVKVTYSGSSEDYKIWKIVPLHYEPGSLTIYKSAEEAPPTAGFKIINLTYPEEPPRSAATDESGVVTIPLPCNCLYEVTETSAPPKNVPYLPKEGKVIVYVGTGEASVSFANKKLPDPDPVTPDIDTPPIADPSGYVFEGIESNRLSGVTTTLYQADDSSGANARLWDSVPFDQQNPLITDEKGQYLWMVPEGWWQVRYELEGYETEESAWMVVPPIRTEVNQPMVSDAPAEASLHYSAENGALVLRFSRPVIAGSLRDLTAAVDGVPVSVWPEAVDADWSVTDDPLDSRVCATAFRLWFDEGVDIADTTISVSLSDAETYRFVSCGAAALSIHVPASRMYYVQVENGTGTGYYYPGDTVTITAYDRGCYPFTHWSSDGAALADANAAVTTFVLPEQSVTVTACYSDAEVHDWSGVVCTRCGTVRNPFTDVKDGDFYLEPVLWAVKNGVTTGTSDTTFSPGDQCMRAQVVTFLWRAAGSPEPESGNNPFVDVKESDFYYKAVLWAVENGITNGLDATHFGPYAYCNRAQVVTFLHRAMSCPQTPPTDCPFTDVQEGLFYYDAVLWAIDSGVTNGMSATEFGVDLICNRAQIVTFLYRTYT